jgi:hypothetical protein
MLKIGINTELGILPFENSPVKNNNEEIKEPIKRESSRIQVKKRSVAPEERQVEKIIYLYKDKTFREYYPE